MDSTLSDRVSGMLEFAPSPGFAIDLALDPLFASMPPGIGVDAPRPAPLVVATPPAPTLATSLDALVARVKEDLPYILGAIAIGVVLGYGLALLGAKGAIAAAAAV